MTGEPRFSQVVLKTIVVHTVTYFITGLVAAIVMDYAALYARPDMAGLMRQLSDPMVMAGPLFQPLRGLVFGVVIYLLRDSIFGRKRGWLVLWGTLVGLGVLSSFGPAPGSIEGLIYTRITLSHQLIGLPEVLIQSLLLALGVSYWVEHPGRRWFSGVMVGAFVVVMLLPVLGLLTTAAGV